MTGGVKRYPVIGHFYQNGDASICSEGDYQNQFPVPPDDKFEVVLASDYDAAMQAIKQERDDYRDTLSEIRAWLKDRSMNNDTIILKCLSLSAEALHKNEEKP